MNSLYKMCKSIDSKLDKLHKKFESLESKLETLEIKTATVTNYLQNLLYLLKQKKNERLPVILPHLHPINLVQLL
jgi:chaperonin cofactor prefoldin